MGKPSCWESAGSGLEQANAFVLCSSGSSRDPGDLGRGATEQVLLQQVLTAQSRAPSHSRGRNHLPSSQVFFKARRGTAHPKLVNVQQTSISLQPGPPFTVQVSVNC